MAFIIGSPEFTEIWGVITAQYPGIVALSSLSHAWDGVDDHEVLVVAIV